MGVAHGHMLLSRLSLHAIVFSACKCNCKNDLIDSSPIWFPTPNTTQKSLAQLCSKCLQLFLNFQHPDHGLRTQREIFSKTRNLGWSRQIGLKFFEVFSAKLSKLFLHCESFVHEKMYLDVFLQKKTLVFRSKTYNSQLWYWNSPHTSVYGVADYSQSFEKTWPSNATPNILGSIMKIYHFVRELIKCQGDDLRSENLSRQ